LSYLTLDVLRFYSKDILNVILHGKVFARQNELQLRFSEDPFSTPPPWFKKSSVLKGVVLSEYT
jgi:hypothetical protein